MYPNWLQKRAELSGGRTGLTFGNRSWTFKELDSISREKARKLAAHGITAGSRVAILSKSHPELVHIIYACLQAGCEVVLLNERLTRKELVYQIRDSDSRFVLVDDRCKEIIDEERQLLFSKLEKTDPAQAEFSDEWPKNRTLSIMYTSGTTGFPKGVRQTAENHFSSAIASSLNIGLSSDDAWLCMMPLFHISGFSILMRSLIYGMEVRLYPKFDEAAAAEELASGTVTHMSVVGVTLSRLLTALEEREATVSPRFKTMLAGGGPVAVSLMERAEKFGISVLQTYGMTETASQTTTLSHQDAKRKQGSSGKPLFLYDVKVDESGEILVKGPHVTPGYIGRFANLTPTENGYLKTGDIGRIDEDGFIYILDRRADLIVSGGENIYPAEIENVLLGHPKVREAGVCGVTDEVWGEVPAAFVVAEDTSADELTAYCQERLASYKVPKQIRLVTELPRNASNKLLRRVLKTWI